MAYADDLLRYARQMAEQYPNEAHQPSLRRALSSAYYALFHLLICDAVATCTDPRFRASLTRMLDHGPMKNVCETTVESIKNLFHPNPPNEPNGQSNIISITWLIHSRRRSRIVMMQITTC